MFVCSPECKLRASLLVNATTSEVPMDFSFTLMEPDQSAVVCTVDVEDVDANATSFHKFCTNGVWLELDMGKATGKGDCKGRGMVRVGQPCGRGFGFI